jgi:hypothetical protein
MNRMVSPILPSLGKSVLLVRIVGGIDAPSPTKFATCRKQSARFFFQAFVAKTRSARRSYVA